VHIVEVDSMLVDVVFAFRFVPFEALIAHLVSYLVEARQLANEPQFVYTSVFKIKRRPTVDRKHKTYRMRGGVTGSL
jgi:hypothetical protein